jgi:protein ImuB
MACVNLSHFPLQLLLVRRPEWAAHPTVVVDRDNAQGVVLWVNEQARTFRVLPGMRYAAALSLSSALRAGVVADEEIAQNVSMLAERLRCFTSDVEPSEHEPGVFWLGASGLSLLYPSLKKWGTLIHADLERAGFHSSVVVGFSRFSTYAVAKVCRFVETRGGGGTTRRSAPANGKSRHGAQGSAPPIHHAARTNGNVVVFNDPAREKEKAATVPINRLGIDPKLRDALKKLGITTLGGFLKLPAAGIRKRFGDEVFRLHKLARGEMYSPLQPDIPADLAVRNTILDHPETNLDRLIVVIEQLITPVLDLLAKRDELLSALVLKFVFDDSAKHTEQLQPASPTLELRQILELVRLRLESVSLSSGITDIELDAQSVRASRKQNDLFEKQSPRDLRAGNRALARIRAELGDGVVLRARLRDGHLPEGCFEWEPLDTIAAPSPRNIAVRPLVRRIFSKPVLFSKTHYRDPKAALAYMHEDRLIEETIGPHVVTGGWWVCEVQREYYFVRTESGRWLWMYYDRRRKCWFLQGEVE